MTESVRVPELAAGRGRSTDCDLLVDPDAVDRLDRALEAAVSRSPAAPCSPTAPGVRRAARRARAMPRATPSTAPIVLVATSTTVASRPGRVS